MNPWLFAARLAVALLMRLLDKSRNNRSVSRSKRLEEDLDDNET